MTFSQTFGVSILLLLNISFLCHYNSPSNSTKVSSLLISQQISHFASPFISSPIPSSATESCQVCVINPSDPLCVYGLDSIHISRAYEGSGHRIRRFLEKALRGEEVVIGVVGASVTFGHGLKGTASPYHKLFFEQFVEVFPKARMVEAALSGMNSQFFSTCWSSVLPLDLDLVLIELDINNELQDGFSADDKLFRSLLSLPSKPAILRVSVIALAFNDLIRGTASSLVLSQYFDVPIISLRNVLLPTLIDQSGDQYFSVDDDGNPDYRHQSALSHRFLADLITLYIREQTCETKRRLLLPRAVISRPFPQESVLDVIPRLKVWKPYSPTYSVPPIIRSCQFVDGPFSPLIPYISSNEGSGDGTEWQKIQWNGKKAYASSTIGAKISFKFEGNNVGIYHYSTNGKGNEVQPGRAKCWIDEEEARGNITSSRKQRLINTGEVEADCYTPSGTNTLSYTRIRQGLTEGAHIITCQISAKTSTGGHEFRIAGVSSR